jgi:MFS transporter, MFS domain-containing protein family, molybdate-anion transporter
MYIFVLQWPPMIKQAIQSVAWTTSAGVPYGKIFSCLMACCLLGSSSFNALQKMNVAAELSASFMLLLATAAIGLATLLSGGGAISLPLLGPLGSRQALYGVIAAFFLFEVCVGMYFPTIGFLRSKYIPDKNRSVIMNLFGLPLNLIVVSVFLSIKTLGVQGALGAATLSLGFATVFMTALTKMKAKSISQG